MRDQIIRELGSEMLLFRRLYGEKIAKRFRRIHVEALSEAEFLLTAIIAEHDGLSMSELCERAMMLKQQVTRLVNQLEEKGMTERRRSQTNRRMVHLHTTQAARELLEEVRAAVRREMDEALSELDEQTLQDYLQATQTINRVLQKLPVGDGKGTQP